MLRNKQRGYVNLDGIGSLFLMIGGAIFVVGFIAGMVTPNLWAYVKPWIHAITS